MQFLKFVFMLMISVAGMLLFTGCDENPFVNTDPVIPVDTGKPVGTVRSTLFMTQSDFQSGWFQSMSTDTRTIDGTGFSIYSDANVMAYKGYVYIVEHLGGDNIIKLDPGKSGTSGIIYQKHIGDNWNPQDIEFVNDTKAYVSCMNAPKIAIFNPSTAEVMSVIDVSSYTYLKDSNTTPHATDLQLVGTDLYAMLQRRNGYKPGAQTLLLKINTLTDQITDTIQLKNKNGSVMTYYDGAIYVTNPGSLYATGDGAIEKVNLADNVVTEVISETALGGNPYMIVHKSGSIFYITNYIGWKNVKVQELDAASGIIVRTLPDVKDAFGGIFFDKYDSTLYVGERDSLEMGIRTFKNNIQTGTVVKSSTSLPVTSLCVFR